MKLSESFFITRKEFPNNEESLYGKLLIKSGMIYKYESGSYFYLPIGLKVLDNIKKLVKEEHKKYGLEEVLLPNLVSEVIYKKSNRDFRNIFSFNDKNNNKLCLSPTHEELFSVLSSLKIKSYKDLHFTLFQISNKYRDENNLSIDRKREFIMCDAYSFDSTSSGMNISYDVMRYIYSNIFKRLDLDYLVCESSPYDMNGSFSEEFHVINEKGENEVIKCNKCTYTSNIDYAQCLNQRKNTVINNLPKKKIKTFNIKTTDEISKYLKCSKETIIKSLIYKIDNDFKLILVRGRDEVNESKLCKIFKTSNVKLATDKEIEFLGGEIGYVGPIDSTLDIIADYNVKEIINGVCGSNEKNYHYINVTPNVDFKVKRYSDIRLFNKTDKCPICKSEVSIYNTLEVGNIFKLETKYSDTFKLKYSNELNEYSRVYMGSYGLGIDRLLNAVVNVHHDEKGLIWPLCIAPYKVYIIVVNMYDKDSFRYASELYKKLNNLGIETILDDRKINVGIKFNDCDLIGVPIRITVGFKTIDNIIELKLRSENTTEEIDKSEIISKIKDIVDIND